MRPRDTPRPDASPAPDPRARAALDEKAAHRELKAAKKDLRRAERDRRRFEKGEVKRFTRRSRNRRALAITAVSLVAALVATVAIAVFSPILALSEIKVTGTDRLSSADIVTAVGHQRGTPLALLDLDRVKDDLAQFPLIRSFVTETVPPDTLVIHVVERQPVALIAADEGFLLIDPAGVTVSVEKKRPKTLPVVKVTGKAQAGETAFDSAIEVLLALPADLAPRVKTISARTQDDVAFELRDVNQRVVWGSAERSAFKARVLNALLSRSDASEVVEFDISSPDTVVTKKR